MRFDVNYANLSMIPQIVMHFFAIVMYNLPKVPIFRFVVGKSAAVRSLTYCCNLEEYLRKA